MVGRLVWVAFGAAAGVVGVRKATKVARSYTPAGLRGSASGLVEAARRFADEVKVGAAEREQELRVALGVDAGAMSEDEARALIDNPYRTRD